MLPAAYWPLAQRYIAADTSHGNLSAAPILAELMAPLAGRFREQHFTHGGYAHANWLWSWGPDEPGGLLLVTHSDTVPAGPPEKWTRGPAHALTRDGDQVVGLGVADVKLDFLCKAFALQTLDLTALKRPLHLLATGAEEVGLIGAKHFMAARLVQPEWVLCGEPSELIPCHAHKGYAAVRVAITDPTAPRFTRGRRIETQGKAAHSSTPHLGVNAVLALLRALPDGPVGELAGGTSANTVPAMASAWVAGDAPCDVVDLSHAAQRMLALWEHWCALSAALEPREDREFSPAQVVNNLGLMRTDGATLSAIFDARLLPEHDPSLLLERFRREAAGADVTFERESAGMRAPKDGKLLTAMSRAVAAQNLPSEPRSKPTSTEAGVFFHAGCEAAVFGPGVSTGNAHTANEWNRERDLALAIPIYAALVRGLCT
jgi:acetylornithine deacetylase/succinyl-diaminopimelate desuccinylase-like protein